MIKGPDVIQDRQISVDLVILTEAIGVAFTPVLEKCIKRHVRIVKKTVRFHSNQKKEGQFTAESVSQIINLRGFRKNDDLS